MNGGRLAVRFKEPDESATHAVVYTHDLNQPSTLWEVLPVLGSASESDHVRRLDVALPGTDSDRMFFKVRREESEHQLCSNFGRGFWRNQFPGNKKYKRDKQ